MDASQPPAAGREPDAVLENMLRVGGNLEELSGGLPQGRGDRGWTVLATCP
jgi:hypothetical protein